MKFQRGDLVLARWYDTVGLQTGPAIVIKTDLLSQWFDPTSGRKIKKVLVYNLVTKQNDKIPDHWLNMMVEAKRDN